MASKLNDNRIFLHTVQVWCYILFTAGRRQRKEWFRKWHLSMLSQHHQLKNGQIVQSSMIKLIEWATNKQARKICILCYDSRAGFQHKMGGDPYLHLSISYCFKPLKYIICIKTAQNSAIFPMAISQRLLIINKGKMTHNPKNLLYPMNRPKTCNHSFHWLDLCSQLVKLIRVKRNRWTVDYNCLHL